MTWNVFVVMRHCSLVVLCDLDAGFEPSQGLLDRLLACCCCCLLLLLLSRLELGPSWVLVLLSAWEITVQETLPALEMCLHGQYHRSEKRLKNGSCSPQNGPPRGTTAWYMPY